MIWATFFFFFNFSTDTVFFYHIVIVSEEYWLCVLSLYAGYKIAKNFKQNSYLSLAFKGESLYYCDRIVESQNSSGWKGLQKTITSSLS